MKFKKLTLMGFKSFADKTDIEFGEGITGIVGPNGCGKSNVADAVRWVLGEQSAKLLRGSNMMDVIFSGTAKRKAQSYAEVALTFDNRNRSLFPSCEFDEVVVSRKLFRSGDSEYYLNGSLCRLRDITEMIRDAGFAIEGYTVIGQGRVQEIINSKPEDRRAIFEEAAGISKFKYKKIAAERKMARTRENLTRLDDILNHDRELLAPLSRQAEKTRQYLDLKSRLKNHEINVYINQYENASANKDRLSAVISGISQEIAQNQQSYNEAVESYNNAVAELAAIETNLDNYRNELTELSVDKEKISGSIKLFQQQLESIRGQNSSLMAANSALNDSYDRLTADSAQKQNELNVKSEELRVARTEFDRLNTQYLRLTDMVVEQESKINEARRALIAAMERRAAINRSVGELTAEHSALTAQSAELSARVEEIKTREDKHASTLSAAVSDLEKLRAEHNELMALRDQKSAQNSDMVIEIKRIASDMNGMQQDRSALLSRKKVLEDVQKDAYVYSVRRLLEDAKADIRINGAIMGVVGQVISVKEGFEAAVDNALGSAVNNVITKNEEDAKLLVAHLKNNRYGRATFLPLTSFKPRSIDPAYESMLDRDGCYGIATDAISYAPRFEPVMRGLLGATVIVENMEVAVRLARDTKYSFRIVTLDGDIVTPQGAITGGSKKSDANNVFTFERNLKELVEGIYKIEKSISDSADRREALSKASDALVADMRGISEDIRGYEIAESGKSAEITALRGELAQIHAEFESDTRSLEQTQARLADIRADLDAINTTEQEEAAGARDEETKRIDSEFAALRGERDKMHDLVSQKNLYIVSLGKDVETLSSDIVRIKSEILSVSQTIESNNMAILGNNRSMEELDERIRQLASSASDGNEKRYAEISAKINGLSDYKNELNDTRAKSDEARMHYNDIISALTEKKHEQEIQLAQVDVNMDMMQQRVWDEYGLAYADCLEFKEENYDVEAGEVEIAKLRRRIVSLGNINENAIEESAELSQKVHQMSVQHDDLIKSIQDEEQIIKEMSANMMRDFNRCFEQIRINFREVFTDLFRGGTADLELTENEDPLARGVEIKAQPPSKNLQSITLLSGGEKTLTAIAILVAIMKLRPMPFCLLDEIEAALDDANVGRVAKILKLFSAKTQVIAITHRKPTMEQADALYGVTMENKGVSKIVSVRLADAIEHAQTVDTEE